MVCKYGKLRFMKCLKLYRHKLMHKSCFAMCIAHNEYKP